MKANIWIWLNFSQDLVTVFSEQIFVKCLAVHQTVKSQR